MRIAIPSSKKGGLKDEVAPHFGRCPSFTVIDLKDKKVESVKQEVNPYFENHMPFAVPSFIKSLDADLLIVSGIGPRAIQALSEEGIDVITGAEGTIGDVVKSFCSKNLKEGENKCSHTEVDE